MNIHFLWMFNVLVLSMRLLCLSDSTALWLLRHTIPQGYRYTMCLPWRHWNPFPVAQWFEALTAFCMHPVVWHSHHGLWNGTRSISQRHSWGPLQITEPMLRFLIGRFDLKPLIWDLASSFYARNSEIESHFCMPFTVYQDGPIIGK